MGDRDAWRKGPYRLNGSSHLVQRFLNILPARSGEDNLEIKTHRTLLFSCVFTYEIPATLASKMMCQIVATVSLQELLPGD